jgi:hypothetical protein
MQRLLASLAVVCLAIGSACGSVSDGSPDGGSSEDRDAGDNGAGPSDAGADQIDGGATGIDAEVLPDCDDGWAGRECEECVVYVDGERGAGSHSGRSWEEPLPTVQGGISVAQARLDTDDVDACSVWAAAGVYVPGSQRIDSFELQPGVHLYGGFAGGERLREQRDWEQNETVLSGDLDGDGQLAGNAYRVVIGADDAVLDGFTITGGFADDGLNGRSSGAGMYNEGSPYLANLVFRGNVAGPSSGNQGQGGGLFNRGSPTLFNVTFVDNQATGVSFFEPSGGGMDTRGGNPLLINVTFERNAVSSESFSYGGGMSSSQNSNPTLYNVVFIGNTVSGASNSYGGGLRIDSLGTVTNATFYDNEAGSGGAIHAFKEVAFLNALVWGNRAGDGPIVGRDYTLDYSLVEGGHAGTGNLDQDPRFALPSGGDLRLLADSPAIDAGYDPTAADFPDVDRAGNPRITDGSGDGTARIDIGAFEFQP